MVETSKRKHHLEDEFYQFSQRNEDTFVRWFQKSNKAINERIEKEKANKKKEPKATHYLTVNNQNLAQK